MADMLDLAIFMDKLQGPIAKFASTKAREVAVAVLANVVYATPADTGKAVSNWLVSLDTPDYRIVNAFAPSPKGHRRKGVWIHVVDPLATLQANAPSALTAGNQVLANKSPGHDIFITNNVEYIQELNSGSSDQAPAGFIDRAILIGNQIVSQARII